MSVEGIYHFSYRIHFSCHSLTHRHFHGLRPIPVKWPQFQAIYEKWFQSLFPFKLSFLLHCFRVLCLFWIDIWLDFNAFHLQLFTFSHNLYHYLSQQTLVVFNTFITQIYLYSNSLCYSFQNKKIETFYSLYLVFFMF